MRLGQITVSNFRAIKEATLRFDDVTILLGENNAGKSTFIAALDLFFAAAPRVKPSDHHASNFHKEIAITVEFVQLTPAEQELFKSNLVDDSLTVTRHFHPELGKDNHGYSVDKLVNEEFAECRGEESKVAKKKIYDALQAKFGLPSISKAEEIEPIFEEWESQNPEGLVRKRMGGFRGFKNVATGQLRKNTDFVLVSAVTDAGAEIGQAKASPVRQLIDVFARQTIQNGSAFKNFVSEALEKVKTLTAPEAVPGLAKINEGLTGILERYYKDSSMSATWQPVNDLPIQIPSAEIAITNHGFTTAIEGVGHGLQRAIVLTVLQYLAEHGAPQEDQTTFEEAQSDIIIAIEEPELYQHPTKQRLFKKVFRELSNSFNKATGIRIQILYTTHSPLLFDFPDFSKLRMIRRSYSEEAATVVVTRSSLNAVSKLLAASVGLDEKQAFSDAALLSRLHVFGSEVAEGFFARCVVLIEGPQDRAIIEAYYATIDRDPLDEGIAFASVEGKSKLDRPAAVFSLLGIPTYLVFDSDKKHAAEVEKAKRTIKLNRQLQRLAGVEEQALVDWPEGVQSRFCSWAGKIEDYLAECAGSEMFAAGLDFAKELYSVDKEGALKTPAVASSCLVYWKQKGVQFPWLAQIVEGIDAQLSEKV